jgi:hypothetical protein
MCGKIAEACDSILLGVTYVWHICCVEEGQELVIKLIVMDYSITSMANVSITGAALITVGDTTTVS